MLVIGSKGQVFRKHLLSDASRNLRTPLRKCFDDDSYSGPHWQKMLLAHSVYFNNGMDMMTYWVKSYVSQITHQSICLQKITTGQNNKTDLE